MEMDDGQPVTLNDRVRAVAVLLDLAEDQDTEAHTRLNAASTVLNAPMFDYESETPALR